MDNKEIQAKQVDLPADATAQVVGEKITQSRRRLFRQGASVVAVTLASRPVLAWHCQSPSAWGSEQINPKTSQKANSGHKSYADETWTISNWINNTSRNSFGNPWAKLKQAYPALYDNSTKTNNKFDYTKVTVAKLFSAVPGLGKPSGMSDNAKVKDVLSSGSNLQKYTIVAQLNFILLAPLAYPNDLEKCVTLKNLNDMASGIYYPLGGSQISWGPADIVKYLSTNYIAVP